MCTFDGLEKCDITLTLEMHIKSFIETKNFAAIKDLTSS